MLGAATPCIPHNLLLLKPQPLPQSKCPAPCAFLGSSLLHSTVLPRETPFLPLLTTSKFSVLSQLITPSHCKNTPSRHHRRILWIITLSVSRSHPNLTLPKDLTFPVALPREVVSGHLSPDLRDCREGVGRDGPVGGWWGKGRPQCFFDSFWSLLFCPHANSLLS